MSSLARHIAKRGRYIGLPNREKDVKNAPRGSRRGTHKRPWTYLGNMSTFGTDDCWVGGNADDILTKCYCDISGACHIHGTCYGGKDCDGSCL